MIKNKNINLDELNSDFINNFDDSYEDIEIQLNITKQQLEDFNNRIINPDNINEVIQIFDFFLIDNMNEFVINHSVPCENIYEIRDEHKFKINLPDFMNGQISCSEIAKYNCLNWLVFAVENKYYWDEDTTYFAGKYGSLECLNYAIENKCPVNKNILNAILECNNLNCLKYIYETYIFEFSYDLIKIASRHGSLDCIKYLHSIELTYPSMFGDICTTEASKNGHLETLKYLHENNYLIGCNTFANAKNIDIIKYLHENKCNWNSKCYNTCIYNNNFEGIKYLVDKGYKLDKSISNYCSKNNNFKILKYLNENKCPWNENVIINSSINGNFKMFEYAIENGCPFNLNDKICDNIVKNNDFHMLLYALNLNFIIDSNTSRLAAKLGNIDILRLLHLFECPWDETVSNCAAKYGNLECLIYCVENGCRIGSKINKFFFNNKNLNDDLSYKRYLCFRYILKKFNSIDNI